MRGKLTIYKSKNKKKQTWTNLRKKLKNTHTKKGLLNIKEDREEKCAVLD